MAPANAGANAVVDFIFRPNRQPFEPGQIFNRALGQLRRQVAFVYDNGLHQAWLVPQLSLMLHLCHEAFRESSLPETQDPIPFANAQPDGARACMSALISQESIVLAGSPGSPTAWTLGHLFQEINTNLFNIAKSGEKPHTRFTITKIFLSDMLAMARAPPKGSPLQVMTPQSATVAWKCLAKKADVCMACSGLGCAISPSTPPPPPSQRPPLQEATATTTEPCRCVTVPTGRDYIIAHMNCLNVLAQSEGNSIQDSSCGVCLAQKRWWHMRGWSESCPQAGHGLRWDDRLLQDILKWKDLAAYVPTERDCRALLNGAVIFGERKPTPS